MDPDLSGQHDIYRGRPLMRGVGQFRILILHPTTENSPNTKLRGTLLVSALERERNNFEALSYVWGSPDLRTTTILIDDIPFEITTHLAAFLCHLRRVNEYARVWVDRICINQSDCDEKSDQVALMGDIYQSCRLVNVWLPDPAETTRHRDRKTANLGGLLSLLSGEHFHDIPGFGVDETTGNRTFEETEDFCAVWDDFLLLAESPWWTRGWTVQEAFLPPTVRFLHNAADPCDISLIHQAMGRTSYFDDIRKPCCAEALDIFPKKKYKAVWDLFHHVRKLSHRRDVYLNPRSADGRDFFYIVVSTFAARQCQQGRDRIYSLWSATGKVYRSHIPDYKIPEEEVYTSVFKSMLRESQSHLNIIFSSGMDFRVFQGLNFGPSTDGVNKRPTWVPDFSQSWSERVAEANLDRLAISRMYRASGWSRGRVKIKGDELRLKGFLIDRVQVVGPVMIDPHDSISAKRTLSQWKVMIQEWAAAQKLTVQTCYRQLSATICGQVCGEFVTDEKRALLKREFILSEMGKTNIVRLLIELAFQQMAWAEHWRPFRPDEDCPKRDELDGFFESGDLDRLTHVAYRNGVVASLFHRALYLTENGRMGLCVPQAMAGDEIWGVYGSKVPFTFRSLKGVDGYMRYNMIGDCYLYDAMMGMLVRSGIEVRLV
ncbi:heterokaryon incompatibility protein-domain-containing protein [Annulohypoxylon maeteangense]|uniref:heterokaryon incompatibility protein-domain-containing protein n=1 Tax=Annulohypoxylon maeteangense TaxID=1927788 RepID=UPI0020082FD1|nr:heterokaryon incompatibility protein-domain-containing protein [Annulohypoxylon maeteangense]KAI0883507.1 heterokaryon incompatibility protein-domain-containing protein [Annulohypoxylon maeteangense]